MGWNPFEEYEDVLSASVSPLVDAELNPYSAVIIDTIFKKKPIAETIAATQRFGGFDSNVSKFDRIANTIGIGRAYAYSLGMSPQANMSTWAREELFPNSYDVLVQEVLNGEEPRLFAYDGLINTYGYNAITNQLNIPVTQAILDLYTKDKESYSTIIATLLEQLIEDAPASLTTRTPIEDDNGPGTKIVKRIVTHTTSSTIQETSYKHTCELKTVSYNAGEYRCLIRHEASAINLLSVYLRSNIEVQTWTEYTDGNETPRLVEIQTPYEAQDSQSETFNQGDNAIVFVSGIAPSADEYIGILALVDSETIYKLIKLDDLPNNAPINIFNYEYRNSFYPIVPLRIDNNNVLEAAQYENDLRGAVRQSERILKMDLDSIMDSIKESEDNDKIDHVGVAFGTSLTADDTLALKYQAAFFEFVITSYMYGNDPVPAVLRDEEGEIVYDPDSGEPLFSTSNDTPADLEDNWSQLKRFALSIHQDGMGMTYGFKNNAKVSISYRRGNLGSKPIKRSVKGKTVYYEIQYEPQVIKVLKLTDCYVKWSLYGTRTTQKIWAHNAINDKTDNFFIPFHQPILDQFSKADQETLLHVSPHGIAISVQRIRLKWYQTTIFKTILIIIAIIVAIETGYDIYTAIATATSVTAAIIAVGEIVLIQYVEALIFEAFVDLVGLEIAMIILAIYYADKMINLISEGNSQLFQNMWADKLLKASAGIQTAITSHMQDDIMDLQQDGSDFADETKEILEEIDELRKMQEALLIDPMSIIDSAPLINFNESPEQYFNRTIHFGNVGTLAYDAVEHYVDLQLKLPEPEYNF